MSPLYAEARSADISWRDALECIAVDGRCISAQEVSDFCSVLFLADRVHVVGQATSEVAAALLSKQLTALGYHVLGADARVAVEATDTVVTIDGPDPQDARLRTEPLLRLAARSGAVLLAIAAGNCSPLLTLADAAIIIPLPRPRGSTADSQLARVAFDLLVSLTRGVIVRELAERASAELQQQSSLRPQRPTQLTRQPSALPTAISRDTPPRLSPMNDRVWRRREPLGGPNVQQSIEEIACADPQTTTT